MNIINDDEPSIDADSPPMWLTERARQLVLQAVKTVLSIDQQFSKHQSDSNKQHEAVVD